MKHLAISSGIYSIEDLEKHYQNKTRGHWFDPDTRRFFKSRLSSELFYSTDVIYFVSSEKNGSENRRYSLRSYDPSTGNIETIGGFQAHKTFSSAKRAALKVIQSKVLKSGRLDSPLDGSKGAVGSTSV